MWVLVHDFSSNQGKPGNCPQTTHVVDFVFHAGARDAAWQEEMDLCRRTLEEKSRAEEQAQKEQSSKVWGS